MTETKYATIDRDELKRLQADANRYRWLRDQCMAEDYEKAFGGKWMLPMGDTLERSIDAAMLAAQGERHE